MPGRFLTNSSSELQVCLASWRCSGRLAPGSLVKGTGDPNGEGQIVGASVDGSRIPAVHIRENGIASTMHVSHLVLGLCLGSLTLLPLSGCSGEPDIGPIEGEAAEANTPVPALQRLGQLDFVPGLTAALQQAQSQQMPILVVFTVADCPYCEQMASGTLSSAEVVAVAERFVLSQVRLEADPETCRQLSVHSFPTLMLLSSSGASLWRHTGPISGPDLSWEMRGVLEAMARRLNRGESVFR